MKSEDEIRIFRMFKDFMKTCLTLDTPADTSYLAPGFIHVTLFTNFITMPIPPRVKTRRLIA
jgi:hypothetical protein